MKNLQSMRHDPRTMATRHYLVGLLVLVSLVVASPALAGKLHKAAEKGKIAKVERLITKGADVNAKDTKLGATPLHYAAKKGHTAVAELLIAKGANVNAKIKNGLTPLHGAARQGHLAIVELLIASGANVNAKDKVGATPLHEPADTGNKAVAELLIAKGANVDARTKIGRTPLNWAVYKGHKIIAELLIASGANVNAKAKDGFTPLHTAADQGHTAVVELLIAKGADINAKDKDGWTPLRLATDRGHQDLARLLKQHGTDQPVAPTRAPPAQATGAFKTYTGHQHQFLIDLPPGWLAYDQRRAITGKTSPFGMVIFSPVNLAGMNFQDQSKALTKIGTGELPSFFVDRHPKKKKMSCRYFDKRELKAVFKMLTTEPVTGRALKVTKALEAQPVTIGGCKGYRIRGEIQGPSGFIHVHDVHVVSDGNILYLFAMRVPEEGYQSNLGLYEKAITTARLTASAPPFKRRGAAYVPGTQADSLLQADITRSLFAEESKLYKKCERSVLKAELYGKSDRSIIAAEMGKKAHELAGRLRATGDMWVEKWFVKSCNVTSTYEVLLTRSPAGGTDIMVKKIVFTMYWEDPCHAPYANATGLAAMRATGVPKEEAKKGADSHWAEIADWVYDDRPEPSTIGDIIKNECQSLNIAIERKPTVKYEPCLSSYFRGVWMTHLRIRGLPRSRTKAKLQVIFDSGSTPQKTRNYWFRVADWIYSDSEPTPIQAGNRVAQECDQGR